MKKNILSLFNFLLLCLIFSCSNLINGIDESNNSVFNKFDSTKEIVVSGKVVVKGAVPQNLIQQDNSQKTAMPQLNSIVSKYKIAATLLDNNDERTDTIKQEIFGSDETDFSIALPFGNWILEGYALDSFENEILYGIFGTSESPTIIISSEGATPPAINIQLSPVCNAEITGKANLKIDVTGAGIKSVEVKWNESNISKVQKFNNSDTTDLTEFYVTLADENDNNENKAAGSYEIQIIFYSNSDYTVPVFTCHELINIFSNLTTNEWKNSGSCSFISDGNFKLTSAIVNKRHYYYINQSDGNDTNEGSSYRPLKHVQTAVDRIIAANDGDDYTIFLMDDYMADGAERYINDGTTPSVVYINNSSGSKPLTLKIQSQKNIQYKINANNNPARVIYLLGGDGHKVSLTLQNITISGGIVQSRGAGILAHDYTDLTISNDVKIEGSGIYCAGGSSSKLVIADRNVTVSDEIYLSDGSLIEQKTGGDVLSNKINIDAEETGTLLERQVLSGGGDGSYDFSNFGIYTLLNGTYCIDSNGKITEASTVTSCGGLLPSACKLTLSTKAELNQISTWANNNTLANFIFVMTGGIDLEGSETDQFTPIGNKDNPFSGIFDGNGHTITGLYINSTSNYQGLFGYCKNGCIKNVCVKGEVKGFNLAGGICGYLMAGVVENCVSYVDVSGTQTVGGICGQVNSNSTIKNCINLGKITGTNSIIGGISGNGTNSQISNCANLGEVTGVSNYGGILGYGNSNSTQKCTIDYCYNAGSVTGYCICGSTTATISNCYYLTGCGAAQNGVQEKSSLEEIRTALNDTPYYKWDKNYISDGNNYPVCVEIPASF